MKIEEFRKRGPGTKQDFICEINFSKRNHMFWLNPLTYKDKIDHKVCHNIESYQQAFWRAERIAKQAFIDELFIGLKVLVGVVSSELEKKKSKSSGSDLNNWKPDGPDGHLNSYGVILGFNWCVAEEYETSYAGDHRKFKFVEGSETIGEYPRKGFKSSGELLGSTMMITILDHSEETVQFCKTTEAKFRDLYGSISATISNQDALTKVIANQSKLLPEYKQSSIEI